MSTKRESLLPLAVPCHHTSPALRSDLKTQQKICWERRSCFHLQVTKTSIYDCSRLTNTGPLLFATPLATFRSSLQMNQGGLCEALQRGIMSGGPHGQAGCAGAILPRGSCGKQESLDVLYWHWCTRVSCAGDKPTVPCFLHRTSSQ